MPVKTGYEDDGDARTISSFSTNATTDDIPGTGRILDKAFQFLGRKLEQLILKTRMRNEPIHPNIILNSLISREFTVAEHSYLLEFCFPVRKQLPRIEPGLYAVAGMLNLMHQTQ